MLDYRKEMCAHLQSQHASQATQSGSSVPFSSKAASSQSRGFKQMNALIRSLSAGGNSLHNDLSRKSQQELTDAQKRELELEACERDQQIVNNELRRYAEEGPVDEEEEEFNLLTYWQLREKTFPTLYRVALDVLPMQASAVPSTMEMLQVLKYSLKEDRLSSTDDWMPNRKEMLRVDASAEEDCEKASLPS
ncbi:hypothetical protein WOLCODRAFT_157278 [Wolfiporia cocos MD-104 SS10]|uniref:HAT C-terminal dimerisation domain-containing protein n=1 Tax=Wolfiporia cocos (strain MD-104) TaxID=742152 RepID=A0A2H3JIR9_WOLCO|nr:hypothetical protein WOLCODRAFT_157278 [Wolfiporia cocos MD-104 SS10]